MTFKLELFIDDGSTGWIDVSNYVKEPAVYPITSRNRNYEPTLEGITLILLKSKISYSNYSNSTKVRFSVDDTIAASYVIMKKRDTEDQDYYKFECDSELTLLKGYWIRPSNLKTPIESGTTDKNKYCATDNEGYTNISVLYLIEIFGSVAGITIDTSELYGQPLKSSAGVNHTVGGVIINYDDLVLDLGMLYCVNQPIATSQSNINNNNIPGYDFKAKAIYFWDLFQRLCAYLRISIRHRNGTYILSPYYSSLFTTIDDNDIYRISEEFIPAKYNKYSAVLNRAPQRSQYYGDNIWNLQEGQAASGANEIPWFNNLLFYYRNKSGNPGDVLDTYTNYADPKLNAIFCTAGYYLDGNAAKTIKRMECPVRLNDYYNANQHYIDTERRVSELEWGVIS